tara:strand:- start:552 stop:1640 length:1089 start_codon:yes stop_codon:yes gene_type:complete
MTINLYKSTALLSFFFYLIFGVFSNNNIHLLIAFIFGLIPFIEFLKKEFYNIPSSLKFFLGVVLITYPISIINNNLSAGFFTLPMVISSLGIAYVFSLWNFSRKIVSLSLVLFLIYFFFNILFLGYDPNEIFSGSRNRISIIFLSLSIFLILLDKKNKNNLYFVTFTFIASILAVGSSGIITSFILFVSCFIYYFNKFSLKSRIIVVLIILPFIYFKISEFISILDLETLSKLNFERIISSDIRYDIWSEYINQYFKGKTLFFGTSYDFFFTANYLGNYQIFENVHSSYFMLHAKTGILSVILLVAIFLRAKFLFSFDKFTFLLFFVILLRAFSDTAFILNGSFNFVFYFFFLPNKYFNDKV